MSNPFFSREGKYIPLPQRQREMNRERERAERAAGGPPSHNRLSGGYRSTPPSAASPRPPLPSASGPPPGISPSERSSPLSGRAGAYTSHHPQGSPSPGPCSTPSGPYTTAPPAGSAPTPASASAAPSPGSPPAPHGHTVPHSHSLPHSLSDTARPMNGGKGVKLFFPSQQFLNRIRQNGTNDWPFCISHVTFWKKITHSLVFISVSARTSPKAQRPPQSSRTARTPNSHTQPTGRKSSQMISPAVKKKKHYLRIFSFLFL